MKTSLKAMAEVGRRAIGLIVAETLFLAILVLAIVLWKFWSGRMPPRPWAEKGGHNEQRQQYKSMSMIVTKGRLD